MNLFEKFFYFINELRMERPTVFGWFHLLWIGIIIVSTIILLLLRKKYNEKQLKTVLTIYGVTAGILELIKQIMWAMEFKDGSVIYAYSWYSAPFQLCTTPIFVSLICSFLKKGKLRDSLLSFMVFYTILGSIATVIYPESCFTTQIEINVHTMFLHCMSLVVSLYIIYNHEVKINKENLLNAFKVFIGFVILALALNIGIEKSGINNGNTFNMFYISPYYPSTLPVFDMIYEKVPYIVFLGLYILIMFLGSLAIYGLIKLFRKIFKVKAQ